MSVESELGRNLAAALTPHVRQALSEDPWSGIEQWFELTIEVVDEVPGHCGVDGYYDFETGQIKVVDRASTRRMGFTALHELGHHLCQQDEQCSRFLVLIDEVARSYQAEELIAHAFAAEILIPTEESDMVFGTGQVRARSVAKLFSLRQASRSACAVRAAERCNGNGYVVVAAGREVIHAAPFGDRQGYPVRRGTLQPSGSALDSASQRETFQGKGRLTFPSGAVTPVEFHVDAVSADGYTFAVFSDLPFPTTEWVPPVVVDRAPEAPEVECVRCGETSTTWNRCVTCDTFECAHCGACPKCDSTRAKVKEQLCPGCYQYRPLASFQTGDDRCVDFCI